MSTENVITLWKPETDVILHQALGKCAEECAELSQALARCLIQGLNESEPVTGRPNRQQLQMEIADLEAALVWLKDAAGITDDADRRYSKIDGFYRWQKMLEAANG